MKKFKLSLKNFFKLIIIILIFNNKIYAFDQNINTQKTDIYKINKKNKIIEIINNKTNNKNFLFYSNEIKNIIAYSGKPLELIINIDKKANILDLKLIKHSEPILLTGIPIEKLLEAISFYKNKNVNNNIEIGENSDNLTIPIITGATVTSLILHETILNTCNEVLNIIDLKKQKKTLKKVFNKDYKKFDWDELIKINAIKNFRLKENNENKIDIYITDLSIPNIGNNLLGDYYNDIEKIKGKNTSKILILNKGTWSFKGNAFVRGGIYDRFRIEQNGNTINFKDEDFYNLYESNIKNIEDFNETGIFVINNENFDNTSCWNLILIKDYKTFNINYKLPNSFYIKKKPLWFKIWNDKIFYISLLLIIWIVVIIAFITKNKLTKNNFYLSVIYNTILILDIYILGFLIEGQPSIVNIFPIIKDFKNVETFILDPYLTINWIMIISTIFIWGKAMFCGWICPFGAIQEIIFKIKLLIGYKNNSYENYLNINTKYIILLILILVSIYDINRAEIIAEIEPFKTIWIIGIKNRPYYIGIYTIGLLLISFYIYRFFCRSICPLGAFFALSSYKIFLNLKRRETCKFCKICQIDCNSNAINKNGFIDSKECFGCFSCIKKMIDKNICPPIKNKNIKYEKNIWI